MAKGTGKSFWVYEGHAVDRAQVRTIVSVTVGAGRPTGRIALTACAQPSLWRRSQRYRVCSVGHCARARRKRRRAAVADLLGEAPPIQALRPDDRDGLSDGILYGVSITKLAYQVEGVPNLHILPSGTGPLDHEAVLRSERWTRLAEGVREVGALLLVAAPGRAKGLESIAAAMDGVVAVGSSTVLPGLRLIARVPAALAVQAPARVRPRTPAAGQQTVSRTP